MAFILLGGTSALAMLGAYMQYQPDPDALQQENRVLFVFFVMLPTALGGIVAWVLCLRRSVALDEMVRVMRHPSSPEWVAWALERAVASAYAFRDTGCR